MMDFSSLLGDLNTADDLDERQRHAFIELAERIVALYPEARFQLWGPVENSAVVYLEVETELEDPDVISDLVANRVFELQVEHDVLVGVTPVHTPERNRQLHLEAMRNLRAHADASLAAT
jgi:hypothetical protein